MASTVAALLAVAELICRVGVVLQAELTLNMLFSIEALAKLSQRGKRSNIGLLGFLEGGFVVDHGQPSPNGNGTISKERTQRIAFPDWPVLIIQDTKSLGDSGNDEASMFELCSRCSNPNRIAMVQLVQQEMLPAIAARDWKQFDIALGRYGRWAGQIFETVQGGIYRTRQIAHSVDVANQLGLKGATQSSWGPTVCAIARDDEHARWCQSRLQSEMPSVVVTTTKAANYSAQVELL